MYSENQRVGVEGGGWRYTDRESLPSWNCADCILVVNSHMNDSTFSALPAQTQTVLARISAAVESVLPAEVRSWPIDVSALPKEAAGSSLIQEVSDWAGKSKACLYYFECRSTSIDLARVERTFANAKTHEANDRVSAS